MAIQKNKNIEPSDKQHKRWTMPSKMIYEVYRDLPKSKRFALMGIFLAVIGIVVSIVFGLFPSGGGDQITVVIESPKEEKLPEKVVQEPKKVEIQLKGSMHADIIEWFQKSENFKLSENSNTKFALTYSGYFREQGNDQNRSYKYTGGYIILTFGHCIKPLKSLKIPRLGSAPKQVLLNKVNSRRINLINQNINLILKEIKECSEQF